MRDNFSALMQPQAILKLRDRTTTQGLRRWSVADRRMCHRRGGKTQLNRAGFSLPVASAMRSQSASSQVGVGRACAYLGWEDVRPLPV